MIRKIYDFFYYYPIRNKITPEIKYFIKAFAVSTYLDYQIKNIEIVNADSSIEEYLKERMMEESRVIRLLKEYMHKEYINLLKKYKKNSEIFEKDKGIIIKYLSLKPNQQMYDFIKRIIKSDNIVTVEERDFLQRVDYEKEIN